LFGEVQAINKKIIMYIYDIENLKYIPFTYRKHESFYIQKIFWQQQPSALDCEEIVCICPLLVSENLHIATVVLT
jgi:hypothetical protein